MANEDDKVTRLNMWAASLVAHRKTDEGYQVGHNAQLVKADSEEEAETIALRMAREKFPEDYWDNYSVALSQIEWHAPDLKLGPATFTIKFSS